MTGSAIEREGAEQVPEPPSEGMSDEEVRAALGAIKWSMSRAGRPWSSEEVDAKSAVLPDGVEIVDGQLFRDDAQRLRTLAALLETVGGETALQVARLIAERPDNWNAFFSLVAAQGTPADATAVAQGTRTWNYRVIRFVPENEVEYALHEVHYRDGKPIAYSENPASLSWFETDEPGAPQRLLKRLAECMAKPVLNVSELLTEQDQEAADWDSMGSVGAERFWEPAHARLPFKKRLEYKKLIDAKRVRKTRRLR